MESLTIILIILLILESIFLIGYMQNNPINITIEHKVDIENLEELKGLLSELKEININGNIDNITDLSKQLDDIKLNLEEIKDV